VKGDVKELKEEFGRMLAKSERMLQAAEGALKDGLTDSAASRAYYAAFHAIQALLRSIDQTYSKHSEVISAFHREFVKTGIFPRRFGKALTRMMRHREIGDYSYILELDPDQVREDVQNAREILDSICRHLGMEQRKNC
jgi:uncharacterized protein (UPF0332 family)